MASKETIITNAVTGGQKGSKAQRFDLMPYAALGDIAEIYDFGTIKYSAHNWRKGYNWGLSFAAMQRHLGAFWDGEDLDPESGLLHLAHSGWHNLALLTFYREHPELDDRFSTVGAQ